MTSETHYGKCNFMHQGIKSYQNTFFREKILLFKRVIIVEIMYSEPKLHK